MCMCVCSGPFGPQLTEVGTIRYIIHQKSVVKRRDSKPSESPMLYHYTNNHVKIGLRNPSKPRYLIFLKL